jgi:hypothetical protein
MCMLSSSNSILLHVTLTIKIWISKDITSVISVHFESCQYLPWQYPFLRNIYQMVNCQMLPCSLNDTWMENSFSWLGQRIHSVKFGRTHLCPSPQRLLQLTWTQHMSQAQEILIWHQYRTKTLVATPQKSSSKWCNWYERMAKFSSPGGQIYIANGVPNVLVNCWPCLPKQDQNKTKTRPKQDCQVA